MTRTTHTDDLLNVVAGDTISFATSEGQYFNKAKCERRIVRPNERTGEIRRITIWTFDVGNTTVRAEIADGLRSSADDPEFPIHREAFIREQSAQETESTTIGYIQDVEIE